MENYIENNKLIAEFMGAKIHTNWSEYLDATYYANAKDKKSPLTDVFSPEEKQRAKERDRLNLWNAKYHSSWDWLMPVVEKIESIKFNTTESHLTETLATAFLVKITKTNSQIIDVILGRFHIDTMTDSKILSTYTAVVQFILWHNANPTHH